MSETMWSQKWTIFLKRTILLIRRFLRGGGTNRPLWVASSFCLLNIFDDLEMASGQVRKLLAQALGGACGLPQPFQQNPVSAFPHDLWLSILTPPPNCFKTKDAPRRGTIALPQLRVVERPEKRVF